MDSTRRTRRLLQLSSTFYNKGFGCGQCVKLQCDDQACAQLGRQVLAMVVDLCGGSGLKF